MGNLGEKNQFVARPILKRLGITQACPMLIKINQVVYLSHQLIDVEIPIVRYLSY